MTFVRPVVGPRGRGALTVLGVVVAGSGRGLVLVEAQQRQEREQRLTMTQQDGGGLGQLLRGPDGHHL